MAEAKKIHLELGIPTHQAELFRVLVYNLNYQEPEDPSKYTGPYGVEIIYEELCLVNGEPEVEFSLWFDRPATAYWFALRLHEAKAAWLLLAQPAPAEYPKFLYSARLGYWCRQNAPGQFCLVSAAQLQVRREREQNLFEPGEWAPITEAQFLQAYRSQREALHQFALLAAPAQYLRRGHTTNIWLYRNAGAYAPNHLRLNASQDEHGRSWQLLYARDVRPQDARRVASSEQEFSQQLAALLADADAVATGQPEGGVAGG